jgi:hypothetical protein
MGSTNRSSGPALGRKWYPISKITKPKSTGGMAQGYQLQKHKAMSSNPSTTKKKKEKKKNNNRIITFGCNEPLPICQTNRIHFLHTFPYNRFLSKVRSIFILAILFKISKC